MMVFKDTVLGILYFCAMSDVNFIITGGPIAITRSTCSRCITFSTPTVTTPFSPREPSSVMMTTSSEYFSTSSIMMTRLAVRPARTDITLFPACFRAVRIGRIAAIPIPPPAQITVPKFSIGEGLPRGPTIS